MTEEEKQIGAQEAELLVWLLDDDKHTSFLGYPF